MSVVDGLPDTLQVWHSPANHLAQSSQAVADHLSTIMCDHLLRRCNRSFAVSVADQPPNSHSFEWRPRHASLPLVLLLFAGWRAGRVGAVVVEVCRVCWGWAEDVLVWERWRGGETIGDFDRLAASRDLERPRTRAVMAPKKSLVARDGDVGDVGDMGGEN